MKKFRLIFNCFSVLLLAALSVNNVFCNSTQEIFDYFQKNGLIIADSYEEFRADDVINKAEFIKLLTLTNGASKNKLDACMRSEEKRNWRFFYYMDTGKNDWYTPYVCYAHDNGLLSERGKFFNPQDDISWFRGLSMILSTKENFSPANSLSSDYLKNYFKNIETPESLFVDMTRAEALGIFFEFYNQPDVNPIVDPDEEAEIVSEEIKDVPISGIVNDPKENAEEKDCGTDKECEQREANRQRLADYYIPGTGGGGGGGGGGYSAPVAQTPICGNRIVETGENCDDGNVITEVCAYGLTACNVCAGNCQLIPSQASYCGDGIVDTANDEECDGGAHCALDCKWSYISSDCYTPVPTINSTLNQAHIWPISGGLTPDNMSSAFGPRLQASLGYAYDFHRGIDIPVPTGTPVLSIADGIVTTVYLETDPANPYPNGGTVVALRHEDNGVYYSLYMHLSTINVIVDQAVTKGEKIALSGSSGTTDFEHLHFEIREGQIDSSSEPHRNPFGYLPFDNTANHTMQIVNPELISPTSPVIQTHITTMRDELDINKIRVSLYNSQCQLLTQKETDFNERINSGLDSAIDNNIGLSPAEFNLNNPDYQLDVTFSALTGNDKLFIVAEAVDVSGNTSYAEATVE